MDIIDILAFLSAVAGWLALRKAAKKAAEKSIAVCDECSKDTSFSIDVYSNKLIIYTLVTTLIVGLVSLFFAELRHHFDV